MGFPFCEVRATMQLMVALLLDPFLQANSHGRNSCLRMVGLKRVDDQYNLRLTSKRFRFYLPLMSFQILFKDE